MNISSLFVRHSSSCASYLPFRLSDLCYCVSSLIHILLHPLLPPSSSPTWPDETQLPPPPYVPPSSDSCLSTESSVVSRPRSREGWAGCWCWWGWMDEALVEVRVCLPLLIDTPAQPLAFCLPPPLSISLSLLFPSSHAHNVYLTALTPCCQALTTHREYTPPPCLWLAGWLAG